MTVTTVPPLPIGPRTNQLELLFTIPEASADTVADSGLIPPREPEGGWLAKLTVQANVVGPLSLAGAQWDATREIVRLGSLSTATRRKDQTLSHRQG